MGDFPIPQWIPAIVPQFDWTIAHLRKYLHGKGFTLFENGTCVVWPGPERLADATCKEILLSVVKHHPDFKVVRHSSGDFLVTFRGGVGGLMPGELLTQNLPTLRAEASALGQLPAEMLLEDDGVVGADDIDLVAGLYVRARLYCDAKSLVIAYVAA